MKSFKAFFIFLLPATLIILFFQNCSGYKPSSGTHLSERVDNTSPPPLTLNIYPSTGAPGESFHFEWTVSEQAFDLSSTTCTHDDSFNQTGQSTQIPQPDEYTLTNWRNVDRSNLEGAIQDSPTATGEYTLYLSCHDALGNRHTITATFSVIMPQN